MFVFAISQTNAKMLIPNAYAYVLLSSLLGSKHNTICQLFLGYLFYFINHLGVMSHVNLDKLHTVGAVTAPNGVVKI